MWINKPFYKYATGIILIILIILLFGQIEYFFLPFKKTIAIIFFPVAISGLLYYLLRPIVHFGTRYMPKLASIVAVFILIAGLLGTAGYLGGPVLAEQLADIAEQLPEKMKKVGEESEKVI